MMLGGNTPNETKATSTFLFLYIEDTDAVDERALVDGAQSISEPGENFRAAAMRP